MKQKKLLGFFGIALMIVGYTFMLFIDFFPEYQFSQIVLKHKFLYYAGLLFCLIHVQGNKAFPKKNETSRT